MILKKKSKTFNDYTLEISWGQLEEIVQALERDHSSPISDELFSELQWYIQRVPGPGEEEEDAKAREEGAVETGADTTGDIEDEDVPIPMPPGQEGGPEEGEAPPPPSGEGALGGEDELSSPEGMEDEIGGEAPPPESEGEDLDQLPAPPAA